MRSRAAPVLAVLVLVLAYNVLFSPSAAKSGTPPLQSLPAPKELGNSPISPHVEVEVDSEVYVSVCKGRLRQLDSVRGLSERCRKALLRFIKQDVREERQQRAAARNLARLELLRAQAEAAKAQAEAAAKAEAEEAAKAETEEAVKVETDAGDQEASHLNHEEGSETIATSQATDEEHADPNVEQRAREENESARGDIDPGVHHENASETADAESHHDDALVDDASAVGDQHAGDDESKASETDAEPAHEQGVDETNGAHHINDEAAETTEEHAAEAEQK